MYHITLHVSTVQQVYVNRDLLPTNTRARAMQSLPAHSFWPFCSYFTFFQCLECIGKLIGLRSRWEREW